MKIAGTELSFFLMFGILCASCVDKIKVTKEEATPEEVEIVNIDTIFGYPDDEYWFEERPIKPNQFMSDFLQDFGIDYQKILELEDLAESTLSLRRIKAGKRMTCIKKGECSNPEIFVYQPDPYQYITYELGEQVYTDHCVIPHHTCLESASGIVTTSLWNAMRDQGMSVDLIDKMEDAIATFDFTMSQVGDEFKYILKLPKGIYYYKFIVDGEWKFSPDDPHTPDENGNINNYIDTTQMERSVFVEDLEKIENLKPMQLVETKKSINTDFKFDDDAPPLPPHFKTILFLNKHEHKLNSFKKFQLNEKKKREAAYLIKILDQPLPPPTHAE